MSTIRAPAVAGFFYPEGAKALAAALGCYLAEAEAEAVTAPPPKAIIVPHAGYVYSGAVAGAVYKT